jgi:hypothetical protein
MQGAALAWAAVGAIVGASAMAMKKIRPSANDANQSSKED